MSINREKEKEVLLIILNRYYDIVSHLTQNSGDDVSGVKQNDDISPRPLPFECQPKHIKKLLNELKNNGEEYPIDKMCRWLGYAYGVIDVSNMIESDEVGCLFDMGKVIDYSGLSKSANEILSIIQHIDTLQIEVEPPYHKLEEMIVIIIEYLKIGEERVDINYVHQVIGYIQGVLISFEVLRTQEERELTRPLLHYFHSKKIKTF